MIHWYIISDKDILYTYSLIKVLQKLYFQCSFKFSFLPVEMISSNIIEFLQLLFICSSRINKYVSSSFRKNLVVYLSAFDSCEIYFSIP